MGIALIGIKDKQPLLNLLSTLSDVLTRITQIIVKLTPIGVFALASSGAGTMSFADLAKPGLPGDRLFQFIRQIRDR